MARRRQAAIPRPGRLRRLMRHGAFIAAALAVVAVPLWGALRLLDPAVLPVTSVQVRAGFVHLERETVRAVIEPYTAEGFLGLDVEALRAELESLPWVRRAAVRRRWPQGVVVVLEEERPVARWASGGLIDETGERFAADATKAPAGLPVLEGPEGSAREVARRYAEVEQMLRPLGVKVAWLRLSERRAWRLRLDNGLELNLGRSSTDRRLLRFVRIYAHAIAPRLAEIESVDLRYANGLAVRWKAADRPTA